MKKRLQQKLKVMACYGLIGIFLQCLLLNIASASDGNAQDPESIRDILVDVSGKDITLKELFKRIEKQTTFEFSYDAAFVDDTERISINMVHEPLINVLEQVAKEKNMSFKRVDNTIFIKKSEEEGEVEEVVVVAIPIKGKVTSAESGEPLPGVNVLVKDTNIGAVTDVNGNYNLYVPDRNNILIFSYIGNVTQQIPINGRSVIDVVMEEDVQNLDQVVVIGYGEQKKSDLTGSVERLEADKFEHQAVTQVSEMLTGTVAGFYAKQGASASGGSSLEIRGKTSLTAGTEPMIVLDGVVYNGSLRDINPNDIATIDILKDASSAAVFGARAASGVILITTKKGKTGKPTINFSTKIGLAETAKDRKPLSAEQFLKFRADYFKEAAIGNTSIPEHFFTDPKDLPDDITVEEWRNYNDNANSDPSLEYLQRLNLYPTEKENFLAGKTIDWYPHVMEKGLRQTYDLSIGGGTDDLTYFWSVGYLDNEGIIRGDKYSAIRSRLNVDFTVTDWLSVGANTQFSERDESSVPASLGLMYIASPFGKMYNEDGTLNLRPSDDPSAYNPLMNYFGQDRNRKINTFFASFYANVDLPFGIKYKLSFQPRYSFTNEHNFWGEQTITGSQTYPGGRATRANSKVSEWMVDNLLTWNKQVGIHNFDVTFLYNAEKYNSWYEYQANQNFAPNANLGYHGLHFGDNPSLSNYDMKQTGDALMGRINYTLLDKYLLTVSLRRDGYSAFGQENPRASFPAAAFAWKVSEEDFFNENWLVNRLKLRVSWGVNGNRDIGAYSALARLGSVLDYDGSNVQVGVQNTSLANRSLTWERTESLNFGVNLGLLENRVDLSADYYVGTTTNLLMNRQLPPLTGFNSITSNLGELENRGFEATISTVNINANDFKWSSNFVFSLNRNKIKWLFGDTGEYTLLGETRTGELPDFSNHWFPGRSIDAVWDYDVIGVWQMEEEEEADVYNMSPGDFKSVDVNEDGEYTDVIDKRFIGFTTPRYRLGFRNEFSYKNFTASIFIRADLGHLIRFNEALQGTLSHDRRNYNRGPMPYWTPENRNNEYARLRPIHSAYGGGLSIYKPGSFVRIQDISLSYAIPASVIERLELNSLSVFGAIRNLYSFDKWPGWDPESRMTPMPRIYTLGLNLSL